MRVIVTGGGGFVGAALSKALIEHGHEVVVLDNFLTGDRASIPSGVRLVDADLRDPSAVEAAMRGVEVIFHEAAVRSVPRSIDDPGLVNDCNVGGTLNVLMGAVSAGARRVVYASSSSVYGDSPDDLQTEEAPPNPLSPYATSKLAAEYYCRVWTRIHGLSTVSLRYFNVFGPGQKAESKYSAVFPAFVSALVSGASPEVHGDGEQSRDFTFIDDVVRANLLAADADERVDGRVINIGGGEPRTVNGVLRAISEAVGKWIDPRHTEPRVGDIRHTRADITRAHDLLGWAPEVPWERAVERTVLWFNE